MLPTYPWARQLELVGASCECDTATQDMYKKELVGGNEQKNTRHSQYV